MRECEELSAQDETFFGCYDTFFCQNRIENVESSNSPLNEEQIKNVQGVVLLRCGHDGTGTYEHESIVNKTLVLNRRCDGSVRTSLAIERVQSRRHRDTVVPPRPRPRPPLLRPSRSLLLPPRPRVLTLAAFVLAAPLGMGSLMALTKLWAYPAPFVWHLPHAREPEYGAMSWSVLLYNATSKLLYQLERPCKQGMPAFGRVLVRW